MSLILDDDIQDIAVEAGAIVLENGGETYRSEETVVRVARSLGAKEAHSFVTPTVVLFSWVNDKGRHFVNMKRIYTRCTNLKKLAMVNDLSHQVEWSGRTEDPKHLRELLHRIETSNVYPDRHIILAAALSSCFFTLMFGGTYIDAACALVFGILLRIMVMFAERVPLNIFIVSLLSGSLVSILAEISVLFPFPMNKNIVMIGTLMQVVPGLALTNAIRDLISGDLMAGSARLMEAVIIAGALSAGAVTGMLLAGIL